MIGWLCWLGALSAVWTQSPTGTQKLKVSVLVLPTGGVPPRVSHQFERELLLALKRNRRLNVRSVDSLIALLGARRRPAGLAQAKRLLKEAEARLLGNRPWLSAWPLQTACTLLERHVGDVKKKTLAKAQFLLARAQMAARQWRAADATLLKLFGWRLSFKTPRQYCKAAWCIQRVLRARARARKLPAGRLSIGSVPSQAKVFLDGAYAGVTPVILLPRQGTHYVAVRLKGYEKKVMPVHVSAGRSRTLRLTLGKTKHALILEQAMPRIRKSLGQPRASSAIKELKTFLLLEQVVVVSLRRIGSDRFKAALYLYDLRTDLLLSGLTRRFEDITASNAENWARQLYAAIHWDGSLVDPGDEHDRPAGPGGQVPWFKKWWFWTAISAVVVGVTVPLGYGLSLRNRGGGVVPKGMTPLTIDF